MVDTQWPGILNKTIYGVSNIKNTNVHVHTESQNQRLKPMELLLLGVILLVTKLTTTCNTSLANQDISCTDPENYTFEECDWDVQGWTFEQGDNRGFYVTFTAQYGVLKSNQFCPSREETYCLQFRYKMDTVDSHGANLSVQILHYNGINQTLWKVVNDRSPDWKNAQIPFQTQESFRIVIQCWKEIKWTDYIGIDSIVYIKSSCAPLPVIAFVTTTPLTTVTKNVTSLTSSASFRPTMLSSPASSCSDQQNCPNHNAGSEGEDPTPLPAIVGSIVGVLVMVIVLVVLILLLKKRRESKHRHNTSTVEENTTSSVSKSNSGYVISSANDYPGILMPKLNNEKPQKNNAPRTISSDDYTNTNAITKHTERPITTTGANLPLKLLNTAIASKSSFEAEGDYTAVDIGDNPVTKDISVASSRSKTEPDEDCVNINKPDPHFADNQVLKKGDNSMTMDSKAGYETLAGDTNDRSPQVSDTYSQVQKKRNKFISMDIGSRTDDVMHAGDSRNVSDTYSLVRRNAVSVAIPNSAVEYNRIDFSNPKPSSKLDTYNAVDLSPSSKLDTYNTVDLSPSSKLDTYNTVDLSPTSAKSESVNENEKACEPAHVNSSEDVYNTLDVEGDRFNSGRADNGQKTGEATQHTYAHMGENFTTGSDTYAKVQNNKKERVFSSDYDHVN